MTPNEPCDPVIREEIGRSYADVGQLLENGEIKAGLARAFSLVRLLNRYFDLKKPWQTESEDPTECDRTLATVLHGIVNLTQILQPFLPFSCARIRQDLRLAEQPDWLYRDCPCGRIIGEAGILFPRLDKSLIAEERDRLRQEEPAANHGCA